MKLIDTMNTRNEPMTSGFLQRALIIVQNLITLAARIDIDYYLPRNKSGSNLLPTV